MNRRAALAVGLLLLVASLVLGGFVGFQAVIASGDTSTATAEARASAQAQVSVPTQGAAKPAASTPTALPDAAPSPTESVTEQPLEPSAGEAFGLVYVPRLRSKAWAQPLMSGIEDAQFEVGIGHFPHSAMPGEVGNFAIAGHRATHGAPFAFIDRLQPGDEVIIRTSAGWFVYALTKDQIVKPEDVWVVDPVPGDQGAEPSLALLTIVTCEPRWGSTSRWIWWGELVRTSPADSPPPAIVAFGDGGS